MVLFYFLTDEGNKLKEQKEIESRIKQYFERKIDLRG
jgi:hypothetical protein